MTQLITVNIQIKGFRNRQFTQGLKNVCHNAAVLGAELFKTKLKILISIPVGRGKYRKVTRRSLPYQPPRRETAELWRSIKLFKEKRRLTYTIYTDVEYAPALEFGYSPRNLLPRPHWLITFSNTWRTIAGLIQSAVNSFISSWTP